MTDIPVALPTERGSEKALRKRIFLGFSVVTLLLALLFIFEGYDASLEFGRQMEFSQLYANANHTVEYLDTVLDEFRTPGVPFLANQFSDLLDAHDFALHLHTADPAVAVVDINGRLSVSLNNIDPEQAQRLIELVRQIILSAAHPMTSHEDMISTHFRDLEDCLIRIDGNEYGWMVHTYDTVGTVITIQKLNTLGMATDTVLTRLLISSLVLLWIGFWASFGVAVFVSKHISKASQALRRAATRDSLTNLPNHNVLISRLEQRLASSAAEKPEASLIFISINNIHLFEQTYGSAVKWQLIRQFSEALIQYRAEHMLVGRFDSDIFYMLVGQRPPQFAQSLAAQMTQQLHQPIIAGPAAFLPSLNIGIAHLSDRVKSADDIISQASHAVRFANQNRRPSAVYSADMSSVSDKKIRRSAELMRALSEDEFELLYQPKIDLYSGEILGVEALVRWDHPQEGRLAPADFIDLIETSCISRQFSRYIVRKAMKQVRDWADIGFHVAVAVNISPYDLQDDSFVAFLREEIGSGMLHPENLELELTETATTINVHHTSKVFRELKELGIRRSIDDFGTGMSSLAYLKEIPIDTVKIDRAFIQNLATDAISQAIVESVIHMGLKLGWSVIAEGIETAETAELLKRMGCDTAQGFYFARPAAAAEVAAAARNGRNRREAELNRVAGNG